LQAISAASDTIRWCERGDVAATPPTLPGRSPGGPGKNDPFFLPAGAEALKLDIPDARVRFFDTGRFALEPHAATIAAVMRNFLAHQNEPLDLHA
jgi:hypothetical protein